jgi:predicted outer membrane repeat protein
MCRSCLTKVSFRLYGPPLNLNRTLADTPIRHDDRARQGFAGDGQSLFDQVFAGGLRWRWGITVVDFVSGGRIEAVKEEALRRVLTLAPPEDQHHSIPLLRPVELPRNPLLHAQAVVRNRRALAVCLRRCTLNATDDDGGGIDASGSVWVVKSRITGNSAHEGGGIHQESSSSEGEQTITVVDSVILGNSGGGICAGASVIASGSTIAGNHGGGIYSGTSVTATDCAIRDNSEHGGIWADGVSIARCTIANNRTTSGGGGIWGGLITAADSTIESNQAKGDGGGIYGGDVTVTNCTIGGNTGSLGGGIAGDHITVLDSRVAGNTAQQVGGGIYGHDVTVSNSEVTNNQSGSHGGGVYGYHVSIESQSRISGNSAAYCGGGVDASDVKVVKSSVENNNSEGLGGGIDGSSVVLIGASMSGNHSKAVGYRDCPRDAYGRIQEHGIPGSSNQHDSDILSPGHNVYCWNDLAIGGGGLSGGQGSILYEVGEEPSQPPPGSPMAAAIQDVTPIEVGGGVRLDASISYGVGSYAWDLNGDGTANDASGATVTLAWPDIEGLGWTVGTNYVTLNASGVNQEQETVTA